MFFLFLKLNFPPANAIYQHHLENPSSSQTQLIQLSPAAILWLPQTIYQSCQQWCAPHICDKCNPYLPARDR